MVFFNSQQCMVTDAYVQYCSYCTEWSKNENTQHFGYSEPHIA